MPPGAVNRGAVTGLGTATQLFIMHMTPYSEDSVYQNCSHRWRLARFNPCKPIPTSPKASKAKLGGSFAVGTTPGALALPDVSGTACELMQTSRLKATQRLAFSNKETLLTFKTSLRHERVNPLRQ